MGRIFALLIIVFVVVLYSPHSVLATLDASLTFDKTSATANVGDTVTLSVIVNAGSNQITSADAFILYNALNLEAQSVVKGEYFPTISQDLSSGRVYVGGFINTGDAAKTGSGTMATITFKAIKAGAVTLSFDCSTTVSNTSKIVDRTTYQTDLDCSKLNTSTITIAAAAGGTTSTTPTPTTAIGTTAIPTPTTTVATSTTTATTQPLPTSLPKTGSMDGIGRWAILGAVLFVVGGVAKLLLKV